MVSPEFFACRLVKLDAGDEESVWVESGVQ